MEPLKPRDKVTQHMTRDGLTLDNQTTGESVNVSSREAEQEYTAQPEGAAKKILERADELHDRHKAKKAAKDAGKTVAQATGPVSRLPFHLLALFPGGILPPRNGPPRSWPRISKRRKNGRISWKRPKKPCRKSASSPRKLSMTMPRARPKAGCILTRWRKPLPSSNQTRPAAPYRKPGFTSTEKSMR